MKPLVFQEVTSEVSALIKNEQLVTENCNLKTIVRKTEEAEKLIEKEREKYELNIQEMQESHDKQRAEQANGYKNQYLLDDYFQRNKHFSYFVEICKIKASNEKELDSLKQQLAEKDTLMDQKDTLKRKLSCQTRG